jgi:hypothetical protein
MAFENSNIFKDFDWSSDKVKVALFKESTGDTVAEFDATEVKVDYDTVNDTSYTISGTPSMSSGMHWSGHTHVDNSTGGNYSVGKYSTPSPNWFDYTTPPPPKKNSDMLDEMLTAFKKQMVEMLGYEYQDEVLLDVIDMVKLQIALRDEKIQELAEDVAELEDMLGCE